MNIKTEFPTPIREIENAWIPLSDGVKLAARIWLPENAEAEPVPAVLEYIPYRKSDGTAVRDALRHPYLAGHGYAMIRVDMRGSGDSDGILYDEYLPQEQDDALEVLAWIAGQPWCTGDIGMFGKSWGGFNSLQVAARRPPELKAVIAVAFTDDRYADDVHYMGGCVLASQMLSWASVMLSYNAAPPDPRFVGERWREMWFDRMRHSPPFVEAWLSHQRRDDFWRHGSVCENYADITCAVYAVGGWADGYTNAVPRLLEGLSCPRKGLIGPWAHEFPETGVPGPAIGFLQESLRWWDYWLKGIDTGIMDEPMLRSWIVDSYRPAPTQEFWPGRWVAEPMWPSPHVTVRHLDIGRELSAAANPTGSVRIQGMLSHGIDGGDWCPYGNPGDFAPDQRRADGQALTFSSAPLDEPLDILGFPEVTLSLSVDRPNALIAVRLNDVHPDGASTLISWGLLNLTHRPKAKGQRCEHLQPALLKPNERFEVTVRLNAAGYRLPSGHRWRVSISPTYWPHAWPSPQSVTLTLYTDGQSRLHLPVRHPSPEDESLSPFEPAEVSPPLAVEILRPPSRQLRQQQDVIDGMTTVTLRKDSGRIRFSDTGLEEESDSVETYAIREGHPLSAAIHIRHTVEYQRDDWQVRLETDSEMRSDAAHFYITNRLDAYEGEAHVFENTWTSKIPRDHV